MWSNWGWEILRRFQHWSDNVWIQAWFRSMLMILNCVTWLNSQGFDGSSWCTWAVCVCVPQKGAECRQVRVTPAPAGGVCDELTAPDMNSKKVLGHDVNRLSSNPAHNLLTLGLCCLQYQELFFVSWFYSCLHMLQLPGYSDSGTFEHVWYMQVRCRLGFCKEDGFSHVFDVIKQTPI